MLLKHELQPVRENLLQNLWKITNKEPIKFFHFSDFLVQVLCSRGVSISKIDVSLLKRYNRELTTQYAKLLDFININIKDGDIIALSKSVRKEVNGSFSQLINQFVRDYEKNKETN